MGQVNGAAVDQVRAWKDPAYRAMLPESVRVSVSYPVPLVDLADPSLRRINGGRRDTPISWCIPTHNVWHAHC
jgi:mersacidin/lichenicidin family type 2 lantibiotic